MTEIDSDIVAIPFSRFGSYFAVSKLDGSRKGMGKTQGIWVRCVHGDAALHTLPNHRVKPGIRRVPGPGIARFVDTCVEAFTGWCAGMSLNA